MARVAALGFEHVQGPQYYRVAIDDGPPAAGRLSMVAMTRFGRAIGTLVGQPYDAEQQNVPTEVARPASADDLARARDNAELAAAALLTCRQLVQRHNLPMRLVHAFWSLDRQQLTFFFTAPGRVDFRGLLRDLVREFQAPIRLEQVGERDVARLIGGIGRCGREVCCRSWLPDFQPVSMRHAKAQDLPPVPSQLAGCCGKLRCCLRYELDEGESATGRRSAAGGQVQVKTASFRYMDDDEDVPLEDEGLRY